MSQEPRKPFEIIEYKISFGERVSRAFTQLAYTLGVIFFSTFLLPINFFKTLFTSKVKAVRLNFNELGPNMSKPKSPPNIEFPVDDDEDWKRAHYEEYGED